MSGILGIWNRDGEPVSRELLSKMSAKMAHRGPEGETQDVHGCTGFAFQMMRVTPESKDERQPVKNSTGAVLMFDGRLDNRDELLSILRPSAKLQVGSPDSAIVMAVFEKFGGEFAKYLNGDFAVAVWDPAQQQLLLARDIMASRTLYFCQVGSTVLFASEVKALLAHPQVKTRPNEQLLVEYLYRIFDYRDESTTFFENISQVPPSQLVRFSSNQTTFSRFWDFDTSKTIRFKTEAEYIDAYKDVFFTAVKRRLRSASPVAITVSGGLDSSSIFCVAEELRRADPQSIPKSLGIGLVPEHESANELKYQMEVETHCGVELTKIPLQTTASLGDFQTEAYHTEAPFLQWEDWRQLCNETQRTGARVLVSGFFGDQLLQSPQYLVDLVLGLRWREAMFHYREYFKWWGEGYSREECKRDLFRATKGYFIPEFVRPFYHKIRNRFFFRHDPLPCYSERIDNICKDLELHRGRLPVNPSSAHSKYLYQMARSKNHSIRMAIEASSESRYQIETVYPFRDRDLIEFVMAIPGEVVQMNGVPRGIHREAMRGTLPELIRLRRAKADFSETSRAGALSDLLQMKDALPNGAGTRLGLLHSPEVLRNEISRLRATLEDDRSAQSSWLAGDVIWLDIWLSVFFSGKR